MIPLGTLTQQTYGGGDLWTPAELSPAVWLDPSDVSTVTLDGSNNVSDLADKSGNNRHLTQSVLAERPTYSAVTGLISATGDSRNLENLTAFNDPDGTLNGYSFFCMAIPTKAGGGTGSQGSSGADFWSYDTQNNCAVRVTGNNSLTSSPVSPIFSISTDYIANTDTRNGLAPFNIKRTHTVGANLGIFGMTRDTAGDRISYINGTSAVGATSTVNDLSWISINYSTIYTAGSPWTGSLGELIVTQNALSLTDVQKLEGYLAHKWGTAASLPVDHPYKSAPPYLPPPVLGPPVTDGLIVYLDSTDPGVVTNQWQDKSGNNNHYNATSGKFPPIDGNGAYFDGTTTGRFLTGPSLAGQTAGEVFMYIRNNSAGTTGTNSGLAHFGTHGDNNHYPYGTPIYLGFGINSRPSIGDGGDEQIDHCLNTSISGGTYIVNTHGVQRYSAGATNSWHSAPTVGKSVGAYYYVGWIKTVLIYNRKLTTQERIDTNAYLDTL